MLRNVYEVRNSSDEEKLLQMCQQGKTIQTQDSSTGEKDLKNKQQTLKGKFTDLHKGYLTL